MTKTMIELNDKLHYAGTKKKKDKKMGQNNISKKRKENTIIVDMSKVCLEALSQLRSA